MAAYLIHVDPRSGYGNPEGMAEYSANVGPIAEAFGGVYNLRHKKTRVLEGPWTSDYLTLIEFESMSRLLEFYESDEYRPWLELRKKAGEGNLIVIED